ncbi:hypothetical protein PKHYL_13770 [Psychrobacter sp. KH172YL61]|nr:hypothetical protein PKHYL_13770 [Psychrobacter sp. KH172YL61]
MKKENNNKAIITISRNEMGKTLMSAKPYKKSGFAWLDPASYYLDTQARRPSVSPCAKRVTLLT